MLRLVGGLSSTECLTLVGGYLMLFGIWYIKWKKEKKTAKEKFVGSVLGIIILQHYSFFLTLKHLHMWLRPLGTNKKSQVSCGKIICLSNFELRFDHSSQVKNSQNLRKH